ncbi:MAG: hypothetical protein ABR591_02425 [Candidatus Velthaea sp.]
MRSLLTRLAGLCVVAVAITGCVGSTGTSAPIAGLPNAGQSGAGNPQTTTTGPGGTGGITVPANTTRPVLLDNGTLGAVAPAATYVGFNVNAVDTQSAVQSPSDPASPAPAFTPPPNPSGAGDLGSHSVLISNITSTQALITSNQTYNLTYTFGGQLFTFSTLVAHFALNGGTPPTSVSAEFVGGTGTNGFDVRVACAPATLAATFARFTCAIPAFANLPATNTTGPEAVNPGATGLFVPSATKIYFDFGFAQPPAAGGTTTVGIDNVYLLQ